MTTLELSEPTDLSERPLPTAADGHRPATRWQMFRCRACGTEGPCALHPLREMMYGSREVFDYVECGDCGTLQIHQIPSDLARHYPADYYSMQPRREPDDTRGLKHRLMKAYGRAAVLAPRARWTRLMQAALPLPYDFAEYGPVLQAAGLRAVDDPILDVGCGASPYRLAAIRRCGFGQVEGLDPFVPADGHYHGIPVHKRTLDAHQGQYALVMFHHSLEHMPDPLDALRQAARLLRPGGTCLVRIPITGTYFWRVFGPHWVELDPPRHLHLLSIAAMRRMAQRVGLRIVQLGFDSEPWEIAASLRYRRDIPLRSTPRPTDGFSDQEMRQFADKVAELNRAGDAGRACFYLRAA